ncbi:MAG: lysozyme inhibitor LprI family protein, partial [Gammaproteobacteria bacterium]
MMSLLVRKCILPLIVYAACLVPAQTHAASFDCANAKMAVEKQICGDILLSVLDDALLAAYTQALAASDSPQSIESQQKDWLSERDRCEERKMLGPIGECVSASYRKRLRVLGALSKGASPSPSFDCPLTRTTVEKLICGDAVLAALDNGLMAVYAKALKTFDSPQALKRRQQQWLRRRAHCEKQETARFVAECVNNLYAERLYEIDNLAKVPSPCPNLPLIEREDQKVQCLKNWLAKHPLKPIARIAEEGNTQFCADFYQAFATASPEIQYIEPVLRTEDPQHPGLAGYRKCRDYPAEEFIGLGYDYFGLDEQAHGFRLYRLNLDDNPKNGLEQYLYEEESPGSMVNGTTQYAQVDLNQCRVGGMVSVRAQEPRRFSKIGTRGLNAMITFKGQYY